MIKLIAVEAKDGYQLALRFSDGASGVCDFAPLVEANTAMTAPLCDRAFFASYYIELGALAWPNGLDFSAGSLYKRLQEAGKLQHATKAA